MNGRKSPIGNACSFLGNEGFFLSKNVGAIKLERSRICLPCGQIDEKMWILTNPHHFLTMCTCDALSVNANRMKQSLNNIRRCLDHTCYRWSDRQTTGMAETSRTNSSVVLRTWTGHAEKCVERYCELANKKVEQLHEVSHPCLDDHQFNQEELDSVVELSEVCSQIVLTCLYLARIGRPDIFMVSEQTCKSSHKIDSGM